MIAPTLCPACLRDKIITAYAAQRQALVERVIALSGCPNWIGYTIAMKGITEEISRIDNFIASSLKPESDKTP